MTTRCFAAVRWDRVLLTEEAGWLVRWACEHGAWMERRTPVEEAVLQESERPAPRLPHAAPPCDA